MRGRRRNRFGGAGAFVVLALGCSGRSEPAERPAAPARQTPARTDDPAAGADPIAPQLRGRPSWAGSVEPIRLAADGQESTVPQVIGAESLIETLGPETVGGGVLLCRVVVAQGRDWDARGLFDRNTAPDVSVYVRVRGGAEARARLPEDTHGGVFSVPGVTLAEGDAVSFRVVDRDVAMDDPIGEVTLVASPAGRPIVVGPLTVRCGLLAESEARSRADAHLTTATTALEQAQRSVPQVDLVHAPDGQAIAANDDIRLRLRDAASYVGFDDPSVRSALGRLTQFERGGGDAYDRAIEDARARAPEPGRSVRVENGIEATITGVSCSRSDDRTRCELRVRADYRRIPDPPSFVPRIDASLLIPGGESAHCLHVDAAADPFIRVVGTVEHVLDCRTPSVVPEGPILARLTSSSGAVLARAR